MAGLIFPFFGLWKFAIACSIFVILFLFFLTDKSKVFIFILST